MKQCSYCVFAKMQLLDDKSDVDEDKDFICIKDAYKITKNIKDNMFWIDNFGEDMKVLGKEVKEDFCCEHFVLAEI